MIKASPEPHWPKIKGKDPFIAAKEHRDERLKSEEDRHAKAIEEIQENFYGEIGKLRAEPRK